MSAPPASESDSARLLPPSSRPAAPPRPAAPFPCSGAGLLSAARRRKGVRMIRAEIEADAEEERRLSDAAAVQGAPPAPPATNLAKVLSVVDLMAYGVGGTIGAGVFVITGVAARLTAGPALVVSFLISAVACLFSGLCYCEFSTAIPVAGSAYTYAYASLGELIGFIIGWNLTLEYGISASAVARGWAGYVAAAFDSFGWALPGWLTALDIGFTHVSPLSTVVIVACTVLTCVGVKESARFTLIITCLNISIILFIIVCGAFYVDTDNWKPFSPFGVSGVFAGAAKVFFSYIGFDSVSGLAQEVRNPQRDLPIGIAGTLGVSAALYCAVALVVTGMVNYTELDLDAPLSKAFTFHGLHWAADLVAVGSVTTLTATTLCSLVGQPRIFMRMAKDGLFFAPFARIHPKYRTPVVGTVATGVVSAGMAFFLDVDTLADMISIGTLLAFSTVCAGVLVMRYDVPGSGNGLRGYQLTGAVMAGALFTGLLLKLALSPWVYGTAGVLTVLAPACALTTLTQRRPEGRGTFRTPLVPFLPVLGILVNTYLVYQLEASALYRLVGWTFIGLVIYLGYGVRHSTLNYTELGHHDDDDDGDSSSDGGFAGVRSSGCEEGK